MTGHDDSTINIVVVIIIIIRLFVGQLEGHLVCKKICSGFPKLFFRDLLQEKYLSKERQLNSRPSKWVSVRF